MVYDSKRVKISGFNTAATLELPDKLTGLQNGGNVNFPTQALLDKIASIYGASLRTYEFKSELVADDIQLGEYALVEETYWSLYKITNDVADTPNIALTSGLTATREAIFNLDAADYADLQAKMVAGVYAAGDAASIVGGGATNGSGVIVVDDGVTHYKNDNIYCITQTGSTTTSGQFAWIRTITEKQLSSVESIKTLNSKTLFDGQKLRVSGLHGVWEIKTGSATNDNFRILVFDDDANRYAKLILDDWNAGNDLPDRYQAMADAQSIRNMAGIPAGLEIGVRSGKTAGLSNPAALSNQPRLNLGNDAAVAAAADSGTGTEADPYIIQDRDLDNTEATGLLNGINWDDASATVYLTLRNCRIANYSGTQITAFVPTKLRLENCQIFSGTGSGNLCRVGRGGSLEIDECDIAGGAIGAYTDGDGTETISIIDSQFSQNGNVWAGGVASQPTGVAGLKGASNISIKFCDFIAATLQNAVIPYGNVDRWSMERCDVSSGIRGFNSLGIGVGKNGRVRYCSFADQGHNLLAQEDLDIGYCYFNDSPDGARVMRLVSDNAGPCKRVTVHHCKFSKPTGAYVAGNEVLESLPNNNKELNEDITFEYNWITECSEDGFEFVGTINGVCRHNVADNCAGQIVDYFTDPTNNLPCINGEIHHIYGDCGDVGIILTDVLSVHVTGHIFIDNTAAAGLPTIAFQALSNPGVLPDYCTVTGPVPLKSSSSSSSAFSTISGSPGPNNSVIWLEDNDFNTFGIDVSGNYVIR